MTFTSLVKTLVKEAAVDSYKAAKATATLSIITSASGTAIAAERASAGAQIVANKLNDTSNFIVTKMIEKYGR